MAKKEAYTCDVCGVERMEANHWFKMRRASSNNRFDGNDLLVIGRWEWKAVNYAIDSQQEYSDMIHLCGQTCAHKLLDQFMSEVSSQPKTKDGPVTKNG